MAIRTILVCLTTQTNADELMETARRLARRLNAHLVGLHTLEALMLYPGIALHLPGSAYEDFNASQADQAEAIEAIFDRYTRNEHFVSEFRLVNAGALSAAERIVECARAADLVIMAQEDPDTDRPDQAHIQERTIRHSGRPVLVIPKDYCGETLGQHVLIGWSPTREATRAAHDAIDLFTEDADINLLSVTGSDEEKREVSISLNDVAASIGRHGYETNIIHRDRAGGEVAAILQQEAFERGADLIVTGAFGHSRFYDFVIGAASDDLLRDMKIPVLFSK